MYTRFDQYKGTRTCTRCTYDLTWGLVLRRACCQGYQIYPPDMSAWEGKRARYMDYRRTLGYQMYGIMGVDRKDRRGRMQAMNQNVRRLPAWFANAE